MNLEQLEKEAKELESLDVTKLSPTQLEQLAKKLELMMDASENLLSETESLLEEINVNENENDEDDN